MHNAEGEIATVLECVGLAARAATIASATFSKGMQQRLGLAVALLGRPELVVLDEPTSALDPSGRLEVREILRDLRRAGTCVFLNSHLLTEVEQVCDRVAIVTRGRVVAQWNDRANPGRSATACAFAQAQTACRSSACSRRSDRSSGRRTASIVARVGAGRHSGSRCARWSKPSAAVFGVEPLTATLEERFLELTAERGAMINVALLTLRETRRDAISFSAQQRQRRR